MKNTNKCMKCNSTAVIQVDYKRGSQFKAIKTGILKVASITRCICCDCGYIEDWIYNKNDLKKLKNKYFPNEK